MFSKPLKEGDTIEADGVTGKVEAITILYTRIVTADNKTVFIPNGVVASGKIINYTDKDTRRVDLNFGISYEDDIDAARKVLLEQVQAAPEALAEPEAKVVVFSHDDSAVVLQLQVWTKSENYWAAALPAAGEREKGVRQPRYLYSVSANGRTYAGRNHGFQFLIFPTRKCCTYLYFLYRINVNNL